MPSLPADNLSGDERQAIKSLSKMWWLWLAFGVVWTIVAVVILQFDDASITTVGVIIGLMFLGAAAQNFVLATLADRGRWLFAIFGVLFLIAAVLAFISPENTFTAIADMLGFLFLIVGVFWIIEAFAAKSVNDLWWLGLVAGILMVILAFWTGGQFFIEKQYLLLVFAGIWALMQGVTDVVRAFQIREIGRLI
ncbi:MAG: HdeD family acid-resistance protein [Solirubrobacterales bacterium]